MPNITIDADQLQALIDTVKSQKEALGKLQRSQDERVREDAAHPRKPPAPAFLEHCRRR